MARLILIKHAAPLVTPGVLPHLWALSEAGKASCNALADRLVGYSPGRIFHSEELKAEQTAAIISQSLQIPAMPADGINEHDRSNVPHLRSAEFISMVELFFRKPDQLVLGRETAAQALDRFSKAIDRIISRHPQENLAVVSHGTVIALFVAAHSDRDGFQLWRDMALPSLVVVASATMQIEQIIPRL
jgi:broad specificity phosphatase PhoE